jgi:GABA(A) receptor-associated protein
MFEKERTFNERSKESQLMCSRYPNRIPVIVQKRKEHIVTIDKRKFMTPRDLNMAQFVFVIRKRLKMKSTEAIFLFTGNTLVQANATLGEIYEKHHDHDGFLYITYDFENAFG